MTTRFGASESAHLPLHGEAPRDVFEAAHQLVAAEGQRLGEHHLAGEEPSRARIGMVARLDDPAAVAGEEPGHRGDDPHAVRAGQRQRVVPSRVDVGHV